MDNQTLNETVEVKPHSAATTGQANFLSVDVQLLILTWITFVLLCAVLSKYAWKPILATLNQREEAIRRSVDEADKIHNEYGQIEEARQKVLREAENKAKETVSQARKAAANVAKVIEQRAKEEAQIIFENTQREIKAERDKVQEALRRESARVAVTLAGKLVREHLTEEKNSKLIDRLIKEV